MGLFKRLFGRNKETLHTKVKITHEYVKHDVHKVPSAKVLYKKTSDLSLHKELNKQRNAYKIVSEYLSK